MLVFREPIAVYLSENESGGEEAATRPKKGNPIGSEIKKTSHSWGHQVANELRGDRAGGTELP